MSIQWNEIEYEINNKKILSNINGKAYVGKILCILGSSGAGKTCLIDIITGERNLTKGNIIMDKNNRIAYVNQNVTLHPFQTVKETLKFYNTLMNKIPISDEIINNYITEFGLWGKKDMFVGNTGTNRLSGGEKKRLSILCSFVMDPDILFLDEPTSGLDAKFALKIMQIIKKYIQEKNIICICSVHQPRQEIWELIDDVLILNQGKQLYYGSRENVKTLLLNNSIVNNKISDVDLVLDSIDILEVVNVPVVYKVNDIRNDIEYCVVTTNDTVIKCSTNDTVIKGYPSISTKLFILLERNISLYYRSIHILFLKILLVVLIGIIEMFILGSGNYILEQLLIKKNLFGCLRFVTFCIIKIFNVSILPISSISLFFDSKDIYDNELKNKLYNYQIYFSITTITETLIQIITSMLYATITWLPKYNSHTDYFMLYLLVIVIQTLIANGLVQSLVTVLNNRDLSLIIIAGYLSLSFLLLIGGNINYQNEFFGMLQFISFLKYPVTILLLKLSEFNDVDSNVNLLISSMNIDYKVVSKLGISGHIMIMLGIYLLLIIISYINISRK